MVLLDIAIADGVPTARAVEDAQAAATRWAHEVRFSALAGCRGVSVGAASASVFEMPVADVLGAMRDGATAVRVVNELATKP